MRIPYINQNNYKKTKNNLIKKINNYELQIN